MTPLELYNKIPEITSNNLNDLIVGSYSHFPEIVEFNCGYWFDDYIQTDIEIRIYKNYDFDGRRFWRLQSVYYKNNPVMITQNAGREGDDHNQRYITNSKLYNEMVIYLKNIMLELNKEEPEDVIDLNIGDVGSFYGNSLDNFDKEKY